MSDTDDDRDDPDWVQREIEHKHSVILHHKPNLVIKAGYNVRPSATAALKLIRRHAPTVPTPVVHRPCEYYHFYERGTPFYGKIDMSYIDGFTLKEVWDDLVDSQKHRMCQDIWHLISQIRDVPRPEDLPSGHYRTTDGFPCLDMLVGDHRDVAPEVMDDETLRTRIIDR
ncbi:hypothetical protein Purlil1_176 [Purpureocillium lilacinum]|uniref:Uncharacterized protein n=1 Tax=Purpureocillium lilacinum TaxID=33203 RepID=A0ABR0CGC3_PURLI|nr:hypothetical protein Purlil1_176 [Purpureocillium lilacinum]GJN67913.1 hypothetical protein PLICBS_001955 [Purpureocillium lilacinum]